MSIYFCSSTNKTYLCHNERFIQFARNHDLYMRDPIPELVTPGKLLMFLESESNRTLTKKGREQPLSISQFKGYVTSIVDLWNAQVSQGLITIQILETNMLNFS